jgi:autotransporter-associated beta strand protein
MNSMKQWMVGCAAAVCCLTALEAAEVENCGINGILSEGASWAGGVAPGPDDTAVWDGAGAAAAGGWAHVLGADASWHGLRGTNCIENLSVTNAGAETLTLGAGGISWASKYVYIDVPVQVAADQSWGVFYNASQSALYLRRGVSGTGGLVLQGYRIIFQAPVDLPFLAVRNTLCFIRDTASMRFPVTVYPSKTLCINTPGTLDWAGIMEARSADQNGILKFGHDLLPIPEIRMRPGDVIAGQMSSSRSTGRVQFENGRLVNDGGTVSNNWLYMRTGAYTQTSGVTWIGYGIYAGHNSNAGQLETGSVFRVAGGTVDAWRLNIGLATAEGYPGSVEISGGEVSVLRSAAADDNGPNGVEIAVGRDDAFGLSADSASGALRMSGGTLNAYQVSFGKLVNNAFAGEGRNVRDGYAAVDFSGGTMNIGALGFGPSTVWNVSDDAAVPPSAWYDVRMSGGTLGALASFTNRARVRLGDENGGLTVRCATPSGAACDIVMEEPLTGPGGLTKTGGGTLRLNMANTYTGRTVVTEGTLALNTQTVETETPDALPAAAATWVADSLGLAAGASVAAWPATDTSHSFTLAIAQAIRSASTAPVIAETTMNGRAAVAFDGMNNALGLTGLNATPVTGATNLTVALVMRSDAAGTGSVSSNFQNNAILLGQISGAAQQNRWGIGYAANGRLGGGVATNNGTRVSSSWAPTRRLGDGDPHVLLFTWTAKGVVTASVDGYPQSLPDLSGVASLIQTRMMLGTSEAGRAFRGEIAEFRFYRNAGLTDAQRRALGRELAEIYGAETAGWLTPDEKASAALASREIRVDAGAALDTGNGGMDVTDGQTLLGAGTVSGNLRVGAGGTVASTNASAALTVSELALQPGGTLRWRFDSTGTAAPLQVGNLTLPDGTVTMEIASDLATPKPFGTLLTYTGELVDGGVVWHVVGGHSATCVEVDAVSKTVRLTTRTGTFISVR